MPGNKNLNSAAKAKNDEFYTQFDDINRELNCYLEYDENVFRDKTILLPCDDPHFSNFTKFFALKFKDYGIKKLISTGYAVNSKKFQMPKQLSLFEENFPQYDPTIDDLRGKIYTLDDESIKSNKYPPDALQWEYLEGNGDFRSDEVKKLRDEADVIITNPPFSLFREFLNWILEADKKFLIIGNINCITYKEVFPLIKENKIWLGNGMGRWISGFIVPEGYELYGTETRINKYGERIVSTNQCLWLTNLEHGRRHQPMRLAKMADLVKHNKHKKNRETLYKKYDNYDAIEVPYTDLIPEDYEGVMGVPMTFLDKYNADQFEILGMTDRTNTSGLRTKKYTMDDDPKFNDLNAGSVLKTENGYQSTFKRILIRHRR